MRRSDAPHIAVNGGIGRRRPDLGSYQNAARVLRIRAIVKYSNILPSGAHGFCTGRRGDMGRHYSTRDFFRQMPKLLLARYFERRGVVAGLDLGAMKEAQPKE